MNREKNVKKAFLWNIIGSSCYSLSSFLYLMVVTRVCGVELAGFFSLSYATAQLLLTVGRFGMRTYQATDLREKYLFREYGVSRILTCSAMMLFGIIYSSFSFQGEYVAISVFIILMKTVDAVEDVFHGNFQQNYHVELMGKMLAARNTYSAAAFTASLLLTKNLAFACTFTSLSSLGLCLLMNGFAVKGMRRELIKEQENAKAQTLKDREQDPEGREQNLNKREQISEGQEPALNRRAFRWSSVGMLLKTCAPLFLGTFLSLLLYNVPKYAMDSVMSKEYQTYYSVLFMPSFVITLLSEFLFKPTITTIAELWWMKEIRKFSGYVLRIVGLILVFTGGIVIGGHLIGRRLLELIYGVDLSSYQLEFIVLLIGGGISAAVYMLYNILIAIRRGGCILTVYAVTAVLTILPARSMVKGLGVMGACINYLYSCTILFIIFSGVLFYQCKKGSKAGEENHG